VRALRAAEIVKMREGLGMTQAEFAETFHVSLSTLRSWEQGQRSPSGMAGVMLYLLTVIPKPILKVLRRPGKPRRGGSPE
jgi:putative transcriptional regulator